jgi:hypothetical protein
MRPSRPRKREHANILLVAKELERRDKASKH